MSDGFGARHDERALLTGFLDWYHAVVGNKVEGLSLDDATRVMTASGLSPLGIVKHLTVVERNWVREVFAGEDVDLAPYDDADLDDNKPTFHVDADDTVASVLAQYRDEVEASRRVIEAVPSLDTLSHRETPFYGNVSLRWVLVHMLEETARHAGHLDLMREQIDGRTGD